MAGAWFPGGDKLKLLESFNEQIDELLNDQRNPNRGLKHAWFTSFNLGIEFVEKYVLPAVLQAEMPRSRQEYEILQAELTDKGIDFRVFCDKRCLDTGESKRTAIPVHGISPVFWSESFSQESLFHPKVIYLESHDGRMIVGAGSANLTLSGWGRNQEVFQFYEITTLAQYRAVRAFFEEAFRNVGLECPLGIRRNFPDENSKWSFVHSFQESTFLEQFFEGSNSSQLVAWSPYLPRDLAAHIERLRKVTEREDLTVSLVTDRIDGKYIRTECTDVLKQMLGDGTVAFYENPTERHQNVELCHSKVWKLPGRLAIGSWNFTGPGSNSLYEDNDDWSLKNNIEAGFIIDASFPGNDLLGKQIPAEIENFASTKLLDENKLDIPKALPFDIWVSFDWKQLRYEFRASWLTSTRMEGYSIELPDVDEPVGLSWADGNALCIKPVPVQTPKELLSEHRFDVIKDGNVEYRGLIIEQGLELRRAMGYDSIGDLLDALVFGINPETDDKVVCRIAEQEDESGSGSESDPSPHMGTAPDGQQVITEAARKISYFRLFKAISEYAHKIQNVKDAEALSRLAFVQPGCLSELVDKANESVRSGGATVFNWFLAQEVNALCVKAKSKLDSSGDCVLHDRLKNLQVTVPGLPPEITQPYIDLISGECGYAG